MTENLNHNFSPLLYPLSKSRANAPSQTPDQIQEAALKRKELLKNYKETRDALISYRAKTEASIAQHQKMLEHEKEKTDSLLNETIIRNSSNHQKALNENNKVLLELGKIPLFKGEVLLNLKSMLPILQKENNELKSQFTNSFQKFMDSFRDIKAKAYEMSGAKKAQDDNSELTASKKNLLVLRDELEQKYHKINRAVLSATYEKPKKLVVSELLIANLIIKEDKQEIIKERHDTKVQARVTSRTPKISEFLEKFRFENAGWLSK